MSKKFVKSFLVVENTAFNTTNFLIRLKAPEPLPELFPGQFVNVDITGTENVFLRRPFSIFEVNYDENTLSLIVKILGKGSKKLTMLKKGEHLNIIYPLGRGFTLPHKNDKILLVGGGSGVAPMLFLAKMSGLPTDNVDILLGARSESDHIKAEEYAQYGGLHFASEDGSLGEKGLVTEHSVFNYLNSYTRVYACGPEGMMKAVARLAREKGIFCEVSLENLMACGFGVCLCCIEPTVHGNLCVCTEGPVFNINDLKWQI